MSDFMVIVPTYNRAQTLTRALNSVLWQTDPDWRCAILDDGSRDETEELVATFVARDRRFRYLRFSENRGGVAMNELGMALACDEAAYWTRLGSDDWFLPRKLELDRRALAEYGACYGPYQHSAFIGPYRGHPAASPELNMPQDARTILRGGGFAVSWANIAYRVEVLHEVRKAFGSFVDARLRNMEDYLFNVRAARFTEFAWRAASSDGTRVIVGATRPDEVPWPYDADAWYTVAADSASYGPTMHKWLLHDAHTTLICRGDDFALGIPDAELPPPQVVIYDTGTA